MKSTAWCAELHYSVQYLICTHWLHLSHYILLLLLAAVLEAQPRASELSHERSSGKQPCTTKHPVQDLSRLHLKPGLCWSQGAHPVSGAALHGGCSLHNSWRH